LLTCYYRVHSPGSIGYNPGMNRITVLILSACFILSPATAWTETAVTGPVSAKVIKVYDGDTFTVEAYPWPSLEAKTSVRVNGVDTPEIRGKCEAEKQTGPQKMPILKLAMISPNLYY